MEFYQMVAILFSIARSLFGVVNNVISNKQKLDAKRLVKTTTIRTVVSAAVATGVEAVAPGFGAVAGGLVAAYDKKMVKPIVAPKGSKERINSFLEDAFQQWLYTDHEKSTRTLKLVKKKLLKALPKKQGLAETVNTIHKDWYGLMPDSTTAITKTWEKGFFELFVKKGKSKDEKLARKYFLEALSYQVAPYHYGYIRNHKDIFEPLRQIFWTDRRVIETLAKKHSLTEEDAKELLLRLANDNITTEDKYDRLAPKK